MIIDIFDSNLFSHINSPKPQILSFTTLLPPHHLLLADESKPFPFPRVKKTLGFSSKRGRTPYITVPIWRDLEAFTKTESSHNTIAPRPNPGLVFEYTGPHHGSGPAEACADIRGIFDHIYKKRWSMVMFWHYIEFRGFRSVDIFPLYNPKRLTLHMHGRPKELVFSGCTLDDYQTLELLALRSRYFWFKHRACEAAIVLENGTSVSHVSNPSTYWSMHRGRCFRHKLEIRGFNWSSCLRVARVLALCRGITNLVIKLEPTMDWAEFHKCIGLLSLCLMSRTQSIPNLTIIHYREDCDAFRDFGGVVWAVKLRSRLTNPSETLCVQKEDVEELLPAYCYATLSN
ncbi:hypothetical protein QCA50_011703 [Cerrena zonata]|uniref:Uncharacterized protein n=1 Tax=Cerrena zonata TaxID=2478898 RepID=A0AAW0G1X1_9APHY